MYTPVLPCNRSRGLTPGGLRALFAGIRHADPRKRLKAMGIERFLASGSQPRESFRAIAPKVTVVRLRDASLWLCVEDYVTELR